MATKETVKRIQLELDCSLQRALEIATKAELLKKAKNAETVEDLKPIVIALLNYQRV